MKTGVKFDVVEMKDGRYYVRARRWFIMPIVTGWLTSAGVWAWMRKNAAAFNSYDDATAALSRAVKRKRVHTIHPVDIK
jgi:signal peptidase I